jgi:iron only hydrogenase large subunit-like protein
MMSAAIIKHVFAPHVIHRAHSEVFLASFMPCVRKQAEAEAPENHSADCVASDVDLVVTTAELADILKHDCVAVENLYATPFDNPMSVGSGGSAAFARSGGVMLAALRYAYAVLTCGGALPPMAFRPIHDMPGVLEADVDIEVRGYTGIDDGTRLHLSVAVVVGLADAKKYVRSGIRRHQFVEVMACAPDGCISGGGQPRGDKNQVSARRTVTDEMDVAAPARSAHDNLQLMLMYDKYLGRPGSEAAHDLLHRSCCEECQM